MSHLPKSYYNILYKKTIKNLVILNRKNKIEKTKSLQIGKKKNLEKHNNIE
jgi:hypothetical protein